MKEQKNMNLFEDDHEDLITIQKLHSGLAQMDQTIPIYTPDVQWFNQRIEVRKQQAKKKLIRDLIIFWILAISIIVLTIYLLNRLPLIYFLSQLTLIWSLPLIFYFLRRKQVKHE